MDSSLILKFAGLMILVCGVIIFFLKRSLISSTEGAVNRLNDEIAKANASQAQLSEKIRKADQELEQRRKEAKEIADRMRSDAETETASEREKIINKARQEGEEIIDKAKNSMEKMKKDLEREAEVKSIYNGVKLLNKVLSEKAKGALNDVLVNEFLEGLKGTDMSKISPEIKTIDVISIAALNENLKSDLQKIIKEKLKRDIEVKTSIDAEMGGGVIVKFGSMALDGSIRNSLRETAVDLQGELES